MPCFRVPATTCAKHACWIKVKELCALIYGVAKCYELSATSSVLRGANLCRNRLRGSAAIGWPIGCVRGGTPYCMDNRISWTHTQIVYLSRTYSVSAVVWFHGIRGLALQAIMSRIRHNYRYLVNLGFIICWHFILVLNLFSTDN